ncbi:MFS transporter, partial [Puniceicoccaceae bacterium K14]|nr:MFS transporter [Puniceicoccaceae bacterium K14]
MMGVEHMLLPVYSLYLGLSPAYIGFAIIFPTFWDGFMGLVVAQFSDNLKTRWGRRKPMIILGAIISAIAFTLIWMAPASWSETV